MGDTAIKGGKVVTREGIVPAGTAIISGKVVAAASDENVPQADKTIDRWVILC